MKVSINDIPEEGLHLDFSSPEWLPDSTRSLGEVKANLVLYNKGSRIIVEGRLRLFVVTSCDRCLCDMVIPIETDFKLHFERVGDRERRGEICLAREELETDFIDTSEIDLTRVLQQQFYLSLPVKQLCSESCLGLCNKCGKDLNKGACHCPQGETSPFSSLASLLKER